MSDETKEEKEILVGGLCDGLEVRKTTEPIIYAGRVGDGVVNVYVRGDDGRLHYKGQERIPHEPYP